MAIWRMLPLTVKSLYLQDSEGRKKKKRTNMKDKDGEEIYHRNSLQQGPKENVERVKKGWKKGNGLTK